MKQLITLIVILASIHLSAQDAETRQWKLGVSFSPDLCYRTLTKKGDSQAASYLYGYGKFMEVPTFGFTTGISGLYTFRNGLELETGVLFARKGYQLRTIYHPILSGNGQVTYAYILRKRHYLGLDLPVKVNYVIGKGSWKMVTSLGVAVNFFMVENRKDFMYVDNGDTDRKTDGVTDSYSDAMVSPEIGLGFSKIFSDRLSVRVLPTFRYMLFDTRNNDEIQRNLWSTGIAIGCYYSL